MNGAVAMPSECEASEYGIPPQTNDKRSAYIQLILSRATPEVFRAARCDRVVTYPSSPALKSTPPYSSVSPY